MEPNSLNNTIYDLVRGYSHSRSDSPSIIATNRPPITYSRLKEQIDYTVRELRTNGINRNDRIGVILPNGPEMASAFLGVCSAATCAPINPQLKHDELNFYLKDMHAKAIITSQDYDTSVSVVAKELGIKKILLQPSKDEAGIFTLEEQTQSDESKNEHATPEDIALILHTSGTTAKPKIVPLTHANLCNSAKNIAASLELSKQDRCLNVMPLFHIHGLVGSLLSSLASKSSIICSEGFQPNEFYKWLEELKPTWYSAVPTIHQSALYEGETRKESIRHSLRFIRSCSSALSPKLMADLENLFKIPVVEAYGMTEASHQMSINPLPPLKRKPGSVGLATGVQIAVMDEEGNILPRRQVGEVVIKGPSVTKGYENNEEANRKAFHSGWFRTGDQGYLDDDNYIFLTDRIKEIINRGGEKVSPREIDEIIASNPAVRQAVTFPIPDTVLGEEVAAAVILKENKTTSEWDLQRYVANRVANYKVPRRIIFIQEIPKGPTGKIQRKNLAQQLKVAPLNQEPSRNVTEYQSPRTRLEEELVEIWSKALRKPGIGINDNYFSLGGDSLRAEEIVTEIQQRYGTGIIPIVIFLHAPTIEKMAHLLSSGAKIDNSPLVTLQPTGEGTPLFLIHACAGEVLFLEKLAHQLGKRRQIYAFRAPFLAERVPENVVEKYAKRYIDEMKRKQPNGPYIIGGAGVGGLIAMEMAHTLTKEKTHIILIDTVDPKSRYNTILGFPARISKVYVGEAKKHVMRLEIRKLLAFIVNFAVRRLGKNSRSMFQTALQYNPKKMGREVLLFASSNRIGFPKDPNYRIMEMKQYLEKFESHIIQGTHLDILNEPGVVEVAKIINEHLNKRSL